MAKRTQVVRQASRLKRILAPLREFDCSLPAHTIGYIDPTPAHEFYIGSSIRTLE